MTKIVCVGDNCVDYYVQEEKAYMGGNPVNVAVYLRELGAASSYIGAVGDDRFGQMLIGSLEERGVDISHTRVEIGSTAVTFVEINKGERILGEYNEGVMADFEIRAEDTEFILEHDLMISGLWGHTSQSLGALKGKIPIAFDFADRPFDAVGKTAMPNVDIAFYSNDKYDTENLKSQMLLINDKGPDLVVATRGIKGSMALFQNKFYEYGIEKCDVADTMGAGDSYIAGFLFAYMNNKGINDCMQSGAKFASDIISRSGAWGYR